MRQAFARVLDMGLIYFNPNFYWTLRPLKVQPDILSFYSLRKKYIGGYATRSVDIHHAIRDNLFH